MRHEETTKSADNPGLALGPGYCLYCLYSIGEGMEMEWETGSTMIEAGRKPTDEADGIRMASKRNNEMDRGRRGERKR